MSRLNQTIAIKSDKSQILAKGLTCFFLFILTTSFQLTQIQNLSDKHEIKGKELITLNSEYFKSYTDRIYRQLEYSSNFDTIPQELLRHALRGYTFLKHTKELTNTKYLTVIDFAQHCNKRRMWVIDLETKLVVLNEWVAHGAKSGDTYAKYFSNKHSSNKSSLGFYTTGGLYSGSNNLSLKLHGLEKDFNTNAFARGIVIHGANYVSENIIKSTERIGRSFGCPAVRQSINQKLINIIKGGSCLFIWHPTPAYLKSSKLLNDNLYLTVDELNY